MTRQVFYLRPGQALDDELLDEFVATVAKAPPPKKDPEPSLVTPPPER